MEEQMDSYPKSVSVEDYIKWQYPYWNDETDYIEDETKILIVEDDMSTTRMFKAMIHKFTDAAAVKSVSSAEDAAIYLNHLLEEGLEGPDVALIDYTLGGENGLAVCRLLEIYFPETKVVLVSGAEPRKIQSKIREGHLNAEFIPKPLGQDQMRNILNS